MTPEEEEKFKGIRHKFYRLGKHGPQILSDMGYHYPDEPSKDICKSALIEIADQGRLHLLEALIGDHEADILAKIGHVGDPCEFCNLTVLFRKPGPCPVRKKQVSP